jgi:hypothetical protein
MIQQLKSVLSQVTQRTATEVYWVSFENMTFSGCETLPEWSMDS